MIITSNPHGALMHSGIKGQKWGRRRYQNEDGTWTTAGKERRRLEYDNSRDDDLVKYSKHNAVMQAYAKAQAQDIETAQKAGNSAYDAFNKSAQALRKADTMRNKEITNKPDLSGMTNKELQDAITRMNLERQYTNLTAEPATKSGAEKAADILEFTGTILAITASALGAAAGIKTLIEKKNAE